MNKSKIYFAAALSLIAFAIAYAQFATPTYTTHYKLRMYSQGQTPGADSLNKNTRVIDSLLFAAMTGATRPDTTKIFYKSDTTKYFSIYRLDTAKVFYRRDTVKYYSIYNFDTSAVGFLNQRNTFTKRNLFSDSIRGTGQVNFDSMKVGGTLNASIINATGSVIGANFIGDGTYLTNLDAEQLINEIDNARLNSAVAKIGTNLDTTRFLDLSDTNKFYRIDTLTTENVKSVSNFWNAINSFATAIFQGQVTFSISPIFSSLVNFANGITVTGTATFNGDVVPTSWVKNLSSVSRDQYEKTIVVRVPLVPFTGAATTYTATHGIPNWRTVTGWTILVQEDSLNINVNASVNVIGSSASHFFSQASVDSLVCSIRLAATSVNLGNDTAKFRITYSDYNR